MFKKFQSTRVDTIARHTRGSNNNSYMINETPQTHWWETCLQRHANDRIYITETYDPYEPIKIKRRDDDQLDIIRFPSYSKFKVPFNMVCKENYSKSVKVYERQLRREIQQIIDNQSTAREATYFVRHMSLTTLWPPYHNRRELAITSNEFSSLSPEERVRFNHIMSHDFAYM